LFMANRNFSVTPSVGHQKFDEFAQLPEQLFRDLPRHAGFPRAFDGLPVCIGGRGEPRASGDIGARCRIQISMANSI